MSLAAEDEKYWTKLYKTVTSKAPLRAYIQGVTKDDKKRRFIVEVTEKQSPNYLMIVDEIMKRLKENDISKEEAYVLKEELISQSS